MVQLIIGATNPNARELLAKIFRQRYEIFVKEKGWNLKTYNGLEFDNYDVPTTLYLAQVAANGDMIASMRMNTTDGPYLLGDVFADMCQGPIPHGRDVWELTRGALSPNLRRSKHYGRMICGVLEAALLWGAKKSIGIYSVDYLMKVIERVMEVLAPGGRLFIGDVRVLPLLEAFHASIQLAKSDGDTSRRDPQGSAQMRRRIYDRLAK